MYVCMCVCMHVNMYMYVCIYTRQHDQDTIPTTKAMEVFSIMYIHIYIHTYTDNMTKTHFNQRKEVFSISIANIIGGICGGIPGTAALARTALNVRSGAKGRMSGVICACMTMVLSVGLMPYFRYVCMYVLCVHMCV